MYNDEFNGRIHVPPNIRNNKQAVVGKFDIRDLIYIIAGGGLFALVFVPLHNMGVGDYIGIAAGLIVALPILIMGFKKFNGMKFEDYIFIYKANKLDSSPVRINNSDNLYEIIENSKNNNNTTTEIKLNPLAKVIFDLTTKNKNNSKGSIKNEVKVIKEKNKTIDKKKKNKKIIKTEQKYIFESVKNILINENISSLDDLINSLYQYYNIKSEIFETYKNGNTLTRISFKTNKIKWYVSGEHINVSLKLENLNSIINKIHSNTLNKKMRKNLFIEKIIKKKDKKNKFKAGIIIYK